MDTTTEMKKGNQGTKYDEPLTSIIDRQARDAPNQVWLEYAETADLGDSLRSITYCMLANAVDSMAWFLHQHLDLDRAPPFQTVAYVGPNDARYCIMLYAAMKARVKVLFTSPKNSEAAHASLLSSQECDTLIIAEPRPPLLSLGTLLDSLTCLACPDLDWLVSSSPTRFPCGKSFPYALNEPCLVLHTSGSTGPPKPLVYTHAFLSSNANAFSLPSPDPEYDTIGEILEDSRFICLLPLFHMAGFCFVTTMSVFFQATPILPYSGVPPSTETLTSLSKVAQARWAAVAPTTLENLSKDADALHAVSIHLQAVAFLGGNLSTHAGAQASRKMRILNLLGSSECGGFPQLLPKSAALWPYLRIHPAAGPVFKPQSPGIWELQILRDPRFEHPQPVFVLYPESQEYCTQDLFEQHPTHPGMWRCRGRLDDMIVFATGEKVNPIDFESRIMASPDVAGALVFGNGQQEAGLLVELTEHAWQQLEGQPHSHQVNDLWNLIQSANNETPSYARVSKNRVCIVPRDKAFVRAPKGTVKRRQSLQLFDEEINMLNSDTKEEQGHAKEMSNHLSKEQITLGASPKDEMALQSCLHSILGSVLGERFDTMGNDTSWFTLGMDSLHVLQLCREIRQAGIGGVTPETIYSHSTIRALAQHIFAQGSIPGGPGDDSDQIGHVRRKILSDTMDYYKEKVRALGARAEEGILWRPARHETRSILITGTTGHVGSHVLREILSCTEFNEFKIISMNQPRQNAKVREGCLNRHPEEVPGMQSHFQRVQHMTASLEDGQRWGLEEKEWESLLSNVALVIHIAWRVDFNIPLSEYRDCLDGLVNLVNFCRQAGQAPPLLFVSSVSAALNHPFTVVPETLIHSLDAPMPGYGESKYLAEHLLHSAWTHHHVSSAVLRVSQVAGPIHAQGMWNSEEWLPRLVRSSRYLGVIPEDLGSNDEVNWIPVDVLARSITEIGAPLIRNPTGGAAVFNLVNGRWTAWASLLPAVLEILQSLPPEPGQLRDGTITRVSGQEWLDHLRASVDSGDVDLLGTENPAGKLLGFMESSLGQEHLKGSKTWDTRCSEAASESLRTLGVIRPAWMRQWVSAWFQ